MDIDRWRLELALGKRDLLILEQEQHIEALRAALSAAPGTPGTDAATSPEATTTAPGTADTTPQRRNGHTKEPAVHA